MLSASWVSGFLFRLVWFGSICCLACRFNHTSSNGPIRIADRFVPFASDRTRGIAVTLAGSNPNMLALSYYVNNSVTTGPAMSISGPLRHAFMTTADALILANSQGQFFVFDDPARQALVNGTLPVAASTNTVEFTAVAGPNNTVFVVGGIRNGDPINAVCIASVAQLSTQISAAVAVLSVNLASPSVLGAPLQAPYDNMFALVVAGGVVRQSNAFVPSRELEALLFTVQANGTLILQKRVYNTTYGLQRARVDGAVVMHRLDRFSGYFVVVAGGELAGGQLADDLDVFKLDINENLANVQLYPVSNVPGALSRPRTRIVGVTVGNQLLYTGGFVEAGGNVVPATHIDVWDAELGVIRTFELPANQGFSRLIALPFADTMAELFVVNGTSTAMTHRSCWSWPFDHRGEWRSGSVVLNNTRDTMSIDLGLRLAATAGNRSVFFRKNEDQTNTLIDVNASTIAQVATPLIGPNVTGLSVAAGPDYACIVGYNTQSSTSTSVLCYGPNNVQSWTSVAASAPTANGIVVPLQQGFAVIGGLNATGFAHSNATWFRANATAVVAAPLLLRSAVSSGPPVHLFGAAALVGNCILVSGGLAMPYAREPHAYLTLVHGFGAVCDIVVGTTSQLATPRFMHSAVTIAGAVYIIGGYRATAYVPSRALRIVPHEPLRSVEVFGAENILMRRRSSFLLLQTGGAVAAAAFRARFLLVAGGGVPWRSQIGWNGIEVIDTWSGESFVYVAAPTTDAWITPQPFAVNRAMIAGFTPNILFATCEPQSFSSHCNGTDPSQVLKLDLGQLEAAHATLVGQSRSFCVSDGPSYDENVLFALDTVYIVIHLPTNFTGPLNVQLMLQNVGNMLRGGAGAPRALSLEPHIGFEIPGMLSPGKPSAALYWGDGVPPAVLPRNDTARAIFHVTVRLGVGAEIGQITSLVHTNGTPFDTVSTGAPPWTNVATDVNRVNEPRIATGIGVSANVTTPNLAVFVHTNRTESLIKARQWLARGSDDMSNLCMAATTTATTRTVTTTTTAATTTTTISTLTAMSTPTSPRPGATTTTTTTTTLAASSNATTINVNSTTAVDVDLTSNSSVAVEPVAMGPNNLPAIVGGVVGGAVALLLIVTLVYCLSKRRDRQRADGAAAPVSEQREMQPVSSETTYGRAPPVVTSGSSEYGRAPPAVNGDDYMRVGAPQGLYGTAGTPGYDHVPSAGTINI
jgi:hypothetical protein